MEIFKLKNLTQIGYWICMLAIAVTIRNFFKNVYFVDFRVYTGAVELFADGGNPYNLVGFPYWPFVYPPIFLIFASSLKGFFVPFLVFLYSLSILSFCFVFRKEPKTFIYSVLISIALFGIRGESIINGIIQGNITFFLHLAIISLWLFQKRLITKIILYTIIAIGSIIKPYFLIYILLPLLADAKISVSRIIPGLITTIAVIAVYALQFIIIPELFADFTNQLQNKFLIDCDTNVLTLCVGFSVVGILSYFSFPFVIAISSHIIVSLLIIAFWLYYRRKYLSKIENTEFARLCISIVPVVICIFVLPRLLVYDHPAMTFLLIYLLLKTKIFEINFNFIFNYKISLLAVITIFIWILHLSYYFLNIKAITVPLIINMYILPFVVIVSALIDHLKKIKKKIHN